MDFRVLFYVDSFVVDIESKEQRDKCSLSLYFCLPEFATNTRPTPLMRLTKRTRKCGK
jgi:hypothetical protein